MQLREAYTILGVEPGLSQEEIRTRYRWLVKALHPDVGGGHEERLGRIIEAYRLIDTQAKRLGIRDASSRRKPRRRSTPTPQHPSTSSRRPAAPPHAAPRGGTARRSYRSAGDSKEETPDARTVFRYGRLAVNGEGTEIRCRALDRLAETKLRTAGVFIRQCMFDTDRTVAVHAARCFPRVPGVRAETVLIELFDQLTTAQCIAVIDTIEGYALGMRRFLAYAAADTRLRIQRRAMEVLRGGNA